MMVDVSHRRTGHYDLGDVRTFVIAAELGSISGAATRLEVAKSVVSQRVARLEKALGARLFERSSRGITLTERGSTYLQQATEALDLLESAAETASYDPHALQGSMRVSVPMSFGQRYLAPLLFNLLERHPDLDLYVDLQDRKVDIAAEGYDLAVRVTRTPDRQREDWHHLGVSRRVICCSPSYAATRGIPNSLSDLASHSCIEYAHANTSHLWTFAQDGAPVAASPQRGRMTTNDGHMMKDAAVFGLGIAVLPLFIVADDLRAGKLQLLLPQEEPTPDEIFAVCALRRHQPRRVGLLIDELRQAFSAAPPWETDIPGLRY